MKLLSLLILTLVSFSTFAQHHSNDDHSNGEFGRIYEKEIGIEAKEGIVELGHIKHNNAETEVFVLTGNIYLAGHMDLDMVGYDRFQLYLLNLINHHNSKLFGMKLETGIKVFGVENQPFGAEPGSSLKFMRINFTELEIVTVKDIGSSGDKKIHFKVSAKLGSSKVNSDLANLNEDQLRKLKDVFDCSSCIRDSRQNWGASSSMGVSIELELGKVLINTYAEYNYDRSRSQLYSGDNLAYDFNYGMHEKKAGVEVEYSLFANERIGHLNLFTSAEYYNLKQNVYDVNNTLIQKNISTQGMLFKVGVKYTLPIFGKKKKRKIHY